MLFLFLLTFPIIIPLQPASAQAASPNTTPTSAEPFWHVGIGGRIGNLVTGDIDGDGRKDVVFQPRYDSSHVYVVNSNGTLMYNAPVKADEYKLADLTNDGKDELVTFWSSLASNTIAAYGRNGNEMWQISTKSGYADWYIDALEGGTGKQILLLRNPYANSITLPDGRKIERSIKSNYTGVWLDIFDGQNGELIRSFQVSEEGITYSTLFSSSGIRIYNPIAAVDDIDHDGKKEILIALVWSSGAFDDKTYRLWAYQFDGVLKWKYEMHHWSWGALGKVSVLDFGDGNKKILLNGVKNTLLGSDGNVIWANEGLGTLFVGVEDILGDGAKDLVFYGPSAIFALRGSNGTKVWNYGGNADELREGITWRRVSIHDIDQDGHKELLVLTDKSFQIVDSKGVRNRTTINRTSWLDASDTSVLLSVDRSLYRVNGQGGLTKLADFPMINNVLLVDLNGDGLDEAIVDAGRLYAIDSSGAMLWDYGISSIQNVELEDLNDDGNWDTLITSTNDYIPNQSIVFRNGVVVGGIVTVVFDDIDGDGRKEALATVRGVGLLVFDSSGKLRWQRPDIDYRQIVTGDINGDGRKEIVVTRGIFSRPKPPAVVIYDSAGKQIVEFGQYWDPPSVSLLRQGQMMDIAVIEPQGRNQYDLAVYDQKGNPVWSYSLDSSKGTALFMLTNIDLNGDNQGDIIIKDNAGITALGNKGEVMWRSGSNFWSIQDSPLRIGETRLLLARKTDTSSAYTSQLYALNASSGSTLWSIGSNSSSKPSFWNFSGRSIIAVSDSNSIYVADERGQTLWKSSVSGLTDSSRVVVADVEGDGHPEFFVGASNDVYIFNSTGSLIWQIRLKWLRNSALSQFIVTMWSVKVEDLNGDGFKEIIVYGDEQVKVYQYHNRELVWQTSGFNSGSYLHSQSIAIGGMAAGKTKQILLPMLTGRGSELTAVSPSLPSVTTSTTLARTSEITSTVTTSTTLTRTSEITSTVTTTMIYLSISVIGAVMIVFIVYRKR